MRRPLFALAPIVMLFLSAGSAGALAKGWTEYRSPFFTVYSDESPDKARDLLEKFELFRRFVILFTGVGSDVENDRLQVIMFRRKGDFAPLAGNPSIRGFYLSTDAGPRMVVGPGTRNMDPTTVLFHEYVHYFLGEYSDIRYPRWYNEGLAEVFGATTITKRKVVIGAVPEGRDQSLLYDGPLGVESLIEPLENVDSSRYLGRFYATAWLFTHYLQIGTFNTDSELKSQTAEYLSRFAAGEGSLAAFEASFSASPDSMNPQLRRYRRSGDVPVIEFPRPDIQTEILERELKSAEAAFLLADISWRLNEEQIALGYLAEIDVADADAAPALSLRAVLEYHNKNADTALQLRGVVLATEQNDSVTLGNLAHLEWDRYDAGSGGVSGDNDSLESAIRYGREAVALDPGNMEAHRFLWKAHAAANDSVSAAKSMVAAYQLYPSSLRLNFEVGVYLLESNKPELARSFVETVRDRAHSDEQRAQASQLLDKIDAAVAGADR